MPRIAIPATLILLALLSGCATQRYDWGNYESALYQHYRNPADQNLFATELAGTLARAESRGKVPPGLYAEYGYELYAAGRPDEAQVYFKKESALWPESRVMMTRLIDLCQKSANKGGAK